MFNPVVVGILLTSALLIIAGWAMVTQEGEDMESQSEDYSYFASKEQEEARKFRHTG